jgi:hypothetical protein
LKGGHLWGSEGFLMFRGDIWCLLDTWEGRRGVRVGVAALCVRQRGLWHARSAKLGGRGAVSARVIGLFLWERAPLLRLVDHWQMAQQSLRFCQKGRG